MATDAQTQSAQIIAKDLLIAAMESAKGGGLPSDPVKAAEQVAQAYKILVTAVENA